MSAAFCRSSCHIRSLVPSRQRRRSRMSKVWVQSGLKEKLEETPGFHGKNHSFLEMVLNPIHGCVNGTQVLPPKMWMFLSAKSIGMDCQQHAEPTSPGSITQLFLMEFAYIFLYEHVPASHVRLLRKWQMIQLISYVNDLITRHLLTTYQVGCNQVSEQLTIVCRGET